MDEFRTLLNQLWIRREDDRELFYRIRRKLPDLRRTLRDQFGWEVVSTETLIRLVKEPGKADAAFGISDLTEISDYCLLCGVLLMLEDKDDGQRFLLSELTQALSAYVKPYWPELSWERYQCRASLVRVLQYSERIGLLHSCEGESNAFASHQEQEVLYENTGLCRYFSVNFHRDISGYTRFRILKILLWTGRIPTGVLSVPIGYIASWRWRPLCTGQTRQTRYMPTSKISAVWWNTIWTKPSAERCRSIITGHFSFRKKESPAATAFHGIRCSATSFCCFLSV